MGKQGSPGDWPSRHTHEAGFPSAGQIEAAASLPDHPVLCLATVADAEIHTEGGVVHLSPPQIPQPLKRKSPGRMRLPPSGPANLARLNALRPSPATAPPAPSADRRWPSPRCPQPAFGTHVVSHASPRVLFLLFYTTQLCQLDRHHRIVWEQLAIEVSRRSS